MTALRSFAVSLCVAIGLLGVATGAQASGGSVMAWGANGRGEVGNGTVSSGGCFCVITPVAVSGLSTAAQVNGAGGGTALALLADGGVVGWGDDYYGVIGVGGGDTPAPVPVTKLPADVISVDVGSGHALALLGNGTVLAWGDGGHGELGVAPAGLESCGMSKCRKAPQPVPGISTAIAISTSESTSFALLADGTVMAWGYDQGGEVGDGIGRSEGCRCVPTPAPVPGVRGAVAVVASAEGGAALLADGGFVDWGTNIEGQIGNGTVSTGGCYCLGPTLVPGLVGVKTLSGGSRFRTAVLANGTLLGWGANNVGQLGTGSVSSEPVSAPKPAAPNAGPVRSISDGYFTSAALLESGAVSTWGYNERGELGNGTIAESDVPVSVGGIAGASAVAGHGSTVYAIVGPSQTLTVALAGAGTGSVGTNGLLCPATACSAKYPQAQTEMLRAEPTAGGFAGFSGPCSGTGPCRVKMDTDQTVTATFGVPKGTAISTANVNSKKKKATFTFSAPGAITGYECKLIKPAKKKKGKGKKHGRIALARKGAKKPKAKPPAFAPCTGPATYKGLKPGKYSFEVRALDILGADATPAVKKFQIKKAKKHRKHKR